MDEAIQFLREEAIQLRLWAVESSKVDGLPIQVDNMRRRADQIDELVARLQREWRKSAERKQVGVRGETMKLTESMKATLADIADGNPLDARFPRYTGVGAGQRRQARYGGLVRTLQGLRRRGLIDRENGITEAGREALK